MSENIISEDEYKQHAALLAAKVSEVQAGQSHFIPSQAAAGMAQLIAAASRTLPKEEIDDLTLVLGSLLVQAEMLYSLYGKKTVVDLVVESATASDGRLN